MGVMVKMYGNWKCFDNWSEAEKYESQCVSWYFSVTE